MTGTTAAPLLTLRAIRTVAVEVPMARPLGTSAQTMRTAPLLLIDLETGQGVTGVMLPLTTGPLFVVDQDVTGVGNSGTSR